MSAHIYKIPLFLTLVGLATAYVPLAYAERLDCNWSMLKGGDQTGYAIVSIDEDRGTVNGKPANITAGKAEIAAPIGITIDRKARTYQHFSTTDGKREVDAEGYCLPAR